jgi:hypothetical protein
MVERWRWAIPILAWIGNEMKKILLLVLFVSMSALFACTAYGKKIELTDGSTLDGEIVSFSEGKYTVQSPSLGTLKIEDSKVRSITSAGQPAVASSEETVPFDPAAIQIEMQKLQPAILGNPNVMKIVVGLISNPDFQALANDPEVVNAAKSLDLKTLMANQKFVKAINDPAIKEVDQKIKEQ